MVSWSEANTLVSKPELIRWLKVTRQRYNPGEDLLAEYISIIGILWALQGVIRWTHSHSNIWCCKIVMLTILRVCWIILSRDQAWNQEFFNLMKKKWKQLQKKWIRILKSNLKHKVSLLFTFSSVLLLASAVLELFLRMMWISFFSDLILNKLRKIILSKVSISK